MKNAVQNKPQNTRIVATMAKMGGITRYQAATMGVMNLRARMVEIKKFLQVETEYVERVKTYKRNGKLIAQTYWVAKYKI